MCVPHAHGKVPLCFYGLLLGLGNVTSGVGKRSGGASAWCAPTVSLPCTVPTPPPHNCQEVRGFRTTRSVTSGQSSGFPPASRSRAWMGCGGEQCRRTPRGSCARGPRSPGRPPGHRPSARRRSASARGDCGTRRLRGRPARISRTAPARGRRPRRCGQADRAVLGGVVGHDLVPSYSTAAIICRRAVWNRAARSRRPAGEGEHLLVRAVPLVAQVLQRGGVAAVVEARATASAQYASKIAGRLDVAACVRESDLPRHRVGGVQPVRGGDHWHRVLKEREEGPAGPGTHAWPGGPYVSPTPAGCGRGRRRRSRRRPVRPAGGVGDGIDGDGLVRRQIRAHGRAVAEHTRHGDQGAQGHERTFKGRWRRSTRDSRAEPV